MTLSINDTQHNTAIMLIIIMMSVTFYIIMLSVMALSLLLFIIISSIMLCLIRLNVIMPSVVAPSKVSQEANLEIFFSFIDDTLKIS
jgi:hypothetical protein